MAGGSWLKMLRSGEVMRGEKFSLMKNVVVISVAFMIQFTAFQSMSALQSSINKASTMIII